MKRTVLRYCAAAFLAVTPLLATAEDPFPSKPIRMIVPFSAGGSTDVVARLVAKEMEAKLGQTVIIENKDGASGAIATSYVARAAPDGYTLCYCTTGSIVILPLIDAKLNYNPERDLTVVTHAIDSPFGVVVRQSLGVNTLKDFVTLVKTNPGKFTFGSPGVATPSHLTGELLNIATGMDLRHIPYRGDTPAVENLLGGHIDAMMLSAVIMKEFVESGKVKALAVTSAKRLDSFPDVPTVAELGYPGFQTNNLQAIFAPAKTPPEIIAKLNTAIVAALHSPEVANTAAKQGLIIVADSPASATKSMKEESERWAPVVQRLDLRR